MAKRSKSTVTKRAITPETMLEEMSRSALVPAPSVSLIEKQGRLRDAAKRFADWAIKKALDFLLLGVIGVMTAPTIAIWLYVKSGTAAWAYPWLYAALGFLTACVLLAVSSALLFYVKARRSRAKDRAKNLKFISTEKGWLDHLFYREKATKEFTAILDLMGRELQHLKAIALFNEAQRGLGGNSQVLNTAVNRLVNVTEGIGVQMQRMEDHWLELDNIIAAKLGRTSKPTT